MLGAAFPFRSRSYRRRNLAGGKSLWQVRDSHEHPRVVDKTPGSSTLHCNRIHGNACRSRSPGGRAKEKRTRGRVDRLHGFALRWTADGVDQRRTRREGQDPEEPRQARVRLPEGNPERPGIQRSPLEGKTCTVPSEGGTRTSWWPYYIPDMGVHTSALFFFWTGAMLLRLRVDHSSHHEVHLLGSLDSFPKYWLASSTLYTLGLD